MTGASDRWCILRTSPARTLPLARSLTAAGFDVWTPVEVVKRRLQRGRKVMGEREVAITPTLVFARAEHLPALAAAQSRNLGEHPPFSIFHHLGRVPLIADREIEALRTAERRATPRDRAPTFAAGQQVRVPEGGFAGLQGIVEDSRGGFTLVCFGGSFRVRIATFLLRSDQA